MRIAIDAREVRPGMRGVGRHVLNLLLGLGCFDSDLEFLVLYGNPLARKVIERSEGKARGRFQWIRCRTRHHGGQAGGGDWRNLGEALEVPMVLKIHRADLFHDVGMIGAPTGGVPAVVTVHELAALHFGDSGARKRARRALRGAKIVIAVSQSVAEEVETGLDISRPRIRVVGNAIDPWMASRADESEIRAMRERFRLPGPYFLCVTDDRPSKNPALAQEAAKGWEGREDWVFTMVGPPERSNGRLHYLGGVEDTWLRPLYAAASAVIVPSLYEGFSLPPLEALATGSIPVVSDIAAHRETLGGILPSSLLFDPGSSASLIKALRVALDGGEPMRSAVLESFRQAVERFSYREKADEVQRVYREALGI